VSPAYIEQLAALAGPNQLWRSAGLERESFSEQECQQLDTGIALRRYALHLTRLLELEKGSSLLSSDELKSKLEGRSVTIMELQTAS